MLNVGRLVRMLSFSMLLIAGCCDASKVPEYTRGLYSKDPKDRNKSALELARCGKDAEPAVSRLTQLLYDENVGVQSSAAYALRNIKTPRAKAAIEAVEEMRRQNR